MAKKAQNGSVNKSQAIRDVLQGDPHMPVKEVIASLSGKGISVDPSLIYFVKGKMKRRKRRALGKSMAEAGVANPVDLIVSVRKLAGEAGGLKKLKQLVDALAE